MNKKETINCPFCNANHYKNWAEENGYTAVKCMKCGIVYVNPRPSKDLIKNGVETGIHVDVNNNRTAVVHRVSRNVKHYQKKMKLICKNIWDQKRPISWLDVGAGYGEFIEAIVALAPKGSNVVGIEPMKAKATKAIQNDLNIKNIYLSEVEQKYDVISLINVFSHIPNFRAFLNDVKSKLNDGGEFIIETGNIGDLELSKEVPTELDIPDHLVFAGEKHIIGYLEESGFSIISITRYRKDGIINFLKNIVKILLRRRVFLAVPYTSRYRSLIVRAKNK